jgi:hypothetical protein
MGIVWRARDERLERIVAVKQLLALPGLTADQRAEARRRALREARIAARLHHANAIVIFDVAEHDGDPFLVMEYMDAKSLSAVLADRGSLPPEEVAAIGGQIASALTVAHRSGIVHRDIKPGNVLINTAGIAKITDFGIARATGDVTVTQSGVFAGTPAYLAPEVARGQDPTAASDVFSFGATLYDAVEGGPPFPERQNQLALLRLVAEGKVQPPRQAGNLTALLMQLLRDDPDARPTMAQATGMLAELTGGKTVQARGPVSPPSVTKPDLVPAADLHNQSAAPTFAMRTSAPPPQQHQFPAPTQVGMPASPGQPTPARAAGPLGNRRMMLVIAVVALVVLIGVGVLVAVNLSGDGSNTAGGTGGSGATTTHSPAGGGTAPANPTSQAPLAVSDNITNYTAAGTQLVAFYGDVLSNPQAAWALLTPTGQQYYGSEQNLAAYWSPYPQMSPHTARVATKNSDGSVQMTILIYNAASGSVQLEMRVVEQNGAFLIDGDSKLS